MLLVIMIASLVKTRLKNAQMSLSNHGTKLTLRTGQSRI